MDKLKANMAAAKMLNKDHSYICGNSTNPYDVIAIVKLLLEHGWSIVPINKEGKLVKVLIASDSFPSIDEVIAEGETLEEALGAACIATQEALDEH